MACRPSSRALIASYLAACLAFLSAAVTAYWLFGGTALGALGAIGGGLLAIYGAVLTGAGALPHRRRISNADR
jgi:hypothetical protein